LRALRRGRGLKAWQRGSGRPARGTCEVARHGRRRGPGRARCHPPAARASRCGTASVAASWPRTGGAGVTSP
jgi:hypothetical protein